MKRAVLALLILASCGSEDGCNSFGRGFGFGHGPKLTNNRRPTAMVNPLLNSPLMSADEFACAQYIPQTGQSNGLGTAAATALTTSSVNPEVLTWDNSGGAPCEVVEGIGACTPLIDTTGGDADVETGLVAMGDQMFAGPFSTSGAILVEAAGASGAQWTSVDSDAGEWTRQLANNGEVEDAATYYSSGAGSAIGCLHVPAMTIWHGEADDGAGTSAATYEGYMQDGYDDLVADLAAQLPSQTEPPALVLMQQTDATESSITLPRSTVAFGQLNAALDLTRFIYLGAPKYAYPHQASSEIHFSAAGQLAIHEYTGWAIGRIVSDASFPRAFIPSSLTVNGGDSSCIDLDYTGNIPCVSGDNCDGAANIALDTTLVDASWHSMGNGLGFQIFDPNPFPAKIDTAPIVSGNIVRVCTDKTIRSGTTVAYAYEGIPSAHGGPGDLATGDYAPQRGNLRDTNQVLGERSGDPVYAWAHAHEPMDVTGGDTPPGNVAEIFDFDFTELWAGRVGGSGSGCPAASGAWVGENGTSIAHNTGTHTCDVATTGLTSGPSGAGIGDMVTEAIDGGTQIWNTASLAIGSRTATQDIWVRWAGCPLRPPSGSYGIFQHRASSTCHYSFTVTVGGNATWSVNTNGCTGSGPASVSINLAALVPTAGNEVWTVCDMYMHARGGAEGVKRTEICCNGTCTSGSGTAAAGSHNTGTIFLNHNSGLTAFAGLTLGIGLGIGDRAFGNVNSVGWPSGTVMVRNINEQAYAAMCPSPPCACTP